MVMILSTWIARFRQDLEPTAGRLNSSLRIVLASIITLLLLMTLRMPFTGLGMYFVFLIGRDSPAVSFRSSVLTLVTLVISVGSVLAVVILTDNDPMARVLSIAVVTFMAGMFMLSSTAPGLASSFGFIFATLIALWETSTPAGPLVKEMLYLIGTISLAVVSVLAVEYIFAGRPPAEELQQQRLMRYQALEAMFTLYAQGADAAQIEPAVIRVSRLAAAGQSGMQRIYNTIVERNLDTGVLPIGTRVRITMLAQLTDISAAFGWQYPSLSDPALRQRCAHIAEYCRYLAAGAVPPERRLELVTEHPIGPDPSLLDRVDGVLHSILSMPLEAAAAADKELVALPSSKITLLIPGALRQPQTIAFALKLTLCATICYIIYQAVAWPGISTAVTTVLITGLSTSGATKQRLIFRLAGSFIGGLILALGATVFLFPYMDSITSLVVLTAGVALLSAWVAAGRNFGYVGLQIAFSFYLVVFAGFSAPTELAPARDRLIGILLALVIMAFVFDQIWPVRTVTAMRSALATILRGAAQFLRLPQTVHARTELLRRADSYRDQIGKTVAGIRSMNDTIEYEFGVDRRQHGHAGETILRAALTSVAFFWNQFAVLHSEQDRDFFTESALLQLRSAMADGMDAMAQSVADKTDFATIQPEALIDHSLLTHPRYGEYVRHSIARFDELQNIVTQLQAQP
ncbi:MAG: Fusaric acid resistance protein conserved region [Edaphobacter sp.]|nr:Fusaric acid resistance protein conserved region [Edaphobacter sp.]